METSKDLRKEFPSVLDRAYVQYKKFRKVDEIMSREVITTTPGATMYEAAVKMGEKRIGSLIVIKYATPLGIVTERDLLSNVLVQRKDPKEVLVKEVMSYPLITICSNAKIREASRTMIEKKGKLGGIAAELWKLLPGDQLAQ